MKGAIKEKMKGTNYVASFYDEVTTMDHGNYIFFQAYIIHNWMRIPLLIAIKQIMDGAKADNLTSEIHIALKENDGLDDIAKGTNQ